MDFGTRLKTIRSDKGLSQEQLAEAIGVSRQAITKWETNRGMPDIQNMIILSDFFKLTLDEFILQKEERQQVLSNNFESETIYDIECSTHFDIHVGSARKMYIYHCEDEKVHIKLLSNSLDNINSLCKVKIDERKNRLDIDCIKRDTISKFELENSLDIIVLLPNNYVEHCEVSASVKELYVKDLLLKRLEYDGNAEKIYITNVEGSLEFTGKQDYTIIIDGNCTQLDINQWRARSLIYVSDINKYTFINKGRRSKVIYINEDNVVEEIPQVSGSNVISISGIKSELVISCNQPGEMTT